MFDRSSAPSRIPHRTPAQRIEAINPRARVTCIEEFITEDNVSDLIRNLDLVLDCIDQVSAKAALIAHARTIGLRVVTCGAAGGRTDPTRIRRADLARALGDPLLAKVNDREKFRVFPGLNKDHLTVQVAHIVVNEDE